MLLGREGKGMGTALAADHEGGIAELTRVRLGGV